MIILLHNDDWAFSTFGSSGRGESGASQEGSGAPWPVHADISSPDDEELVELLAVGDEDFPEAGEFGLGRRRAEPTKPDDAGVGESQACDEFAEVLVVGQENPSLGAGDGEHLFVWERVGIVVSDGGHVVMPLLRKPGRDAVLHALIEEKSHRRTGVPWGAGSGGVRRWVLGRCARA